MSNLIGRFRKQMNLSQAELASMVGISRQSLHSIELGRQEPRVSIAIAVAHVLGVEVEQLFPRSSPGGFKVENQGPAEEPFRACRSEVDGQQVFRRAVSVGFGQVPLRADVVMRKVGSAYKLEAELDSSTLFIDGCDPILEVISNKINEGRENLRVSCFYGSNANSLDKLREGWTHGALMHGNSEELDRMGNAEPAAVAVPFGNWDLVLGFRSDNPKGIHTDKDLVREDLILAVRETGSGVRSFLDQFFDQHGADPERLSAARSFGDHYQVAAAITLGMCDAGVLPVSIAQSVGLKYIPVGTHRSSFVFSRSGYARAIESGFLDQLYSRSLEKELTAIGGYQVIH